jgi:hypothetical protein
MSNKINYVITPNVVSWVDPETLEEIAVSNNEKAYNKCVLALLSGRYPTKEEMDDSQDKTEYIPAPEIISKYPHLEEKWMSIQDKNYVKSDIEIYLATLEKFAERLTKNPSARSVEQLLTFIEKNNVPIMHDGRLLTFKRVRGDYYDIHTAKTNKYVVGSEHSMPRNEVDDDPRSACSHGLHVGGYNYVASFLGERLIGVIVDPADVVSIPYDSAFGKIRCCRLEVAFEFASIDEMFKVSETLVCVPHEQMADIDEIRRLEREAIQREIEYERSISPELFGITTSVVADEFYDDEYEEYSNGDFHFIGKIDMSDIEGKSDLYQLGFFHGITSQNEVSNDRDYEQGYTAGIIAALRNKNAK